MNENRKSQSDEEEILHAFADLLDEVVPEEPEEIERLLREAGLDPGQIESETRALIHELRSSTPLDWRNKGGQIKAIVDQHEKSRDQLPSTRDELLKIWKELNSKPQARVLSAHYRNQKPEDLSDEELASLIQDFMFILDNHEQSDHGFE